MYYLFLDDERTPDQVKWVKLPNVGWVVVRNFEQFSRYIIKNGLPRFVAFDHDLGEPTTGLDCAKWLIEYCQYHKLKMPEFIVHSMNPVGKENIEGFLECAKKHT